MTSLLYRGYVEHRRHEPRPHRLIYRLYVYAFDLAELTDLDRRLPLFGYNRPRPVSLRDRDYLDNTNRSIRSKLLAMAHPRLPLALLCEMAGDQPTFRTGCRHEEEPDTAPAEPDHG